MRMLESDHWMLRPFILTGFAALLAATTISLPLPARAQIGNIFSDQPRPPGNVPRGGQQPMPEDEEEVPELPQGGRLLPTPSRPLPGQGVPPPGAVQSQPLAPPPGVAVAPQNQPGVGVVPPQPNQNVAVAPPAPMSPDSVDPRACRKRQRRCSPATRWSPNRRPRRSSTRRRASQAWTRSPAASSTLTKTSARPFSSARCA